MIVQIVGNHPCAAEAPAIPGASRWVIGVAYRHLGDGWPFDLLADPHKPAVIDDWRTDGVWDRYRAMVAAGKRVVFLEPHPDVPGSEGLPRQAIQQAFAYEGQIETAFNSTLDWLVAWALLEGATWIDVQGVGLRHPNYLNERETMRYWMGRARGMGVRLTVPALSGLDGVHTLYGYDEPTGHVGIPGESVTVTGFPGLVSVHA